MTARSPLELESPHQSVVRLNRRVIYVVGAVLILVFVTGLFALRGQNARRDEGATERRTRMRSPRAWFEDVPDHVPAPQPIAEAPRQRPVVTKPPVVRSAALDELESQRWQRGLRAATSAPIAVAAFERGDRDRAGRGDRDAAARRRIDSVTAIPTAAGRVGSAVAREDTKANGPAPEYLRAAVRKPASPYEIKAGTIIPAVLFSAVNSDLPGQIVGQVRESVYDSDSGEHLLIPQGTRLVGLYDHRIVDGQQRVLVTWKRLLMPDGSSLTLSDGLPGTDALGAAGLHDRVDNHYLRIFGNALLLSVISAGIQLGQTPDFGRDFRGPTAGNVLGAAVGQQFGAVSSELIRRGMTRAPTLEIRPGFPFNIMVTQDMVFPGPYEQARPR